MAVRRYGLSAPSALHREGIVHGGVKPSNIMLECTDNAKLSDIGAAFAREDAPLYAGLRRARGPGGVGGLGTIVRTLGRRPSIVPLGTRPRSSNASRLWLRPQP
jgi:serine/threonine protein kinase